MTIKNPQPKWLPQSVHTMVKPRGPICNLDCEYCYFLSKEQLYPNSSFIMSDELLEEYTRQYIQVQNVPEVTFAWQGGEPTLMGLDFYMRAVGHQKKYARPGMRIENTLQTNGTLMDDSWCEFFKENNFLIGISIDGPKEIHDLYRKNKGGEGSFLQVIEGLCLLKKHDVEYNILCTVNAANAKHALDVYKFFRDELSANFIQFIPIVERENGTRYQDGNEVSLRSVTGKQYGEFLITIFDEWVKKDVGTVVVQMFDVALGKWFGTPGGLCVFEETCGLGLAMEHNGDVYSCDHYVEPKYKIGNIKSTELIDLVRSEKQFNFGMNKRESLTKQCLTCDVRFACNGGCPKNRIIHSVDGELGLNYLCDGYFAFFKHIDVPMKRMTELLREKRSPAEIMELKL